MKRTTAALVVIIGLVFASLAIAAGNPPVNTALPAISGTAQQGQTLTASDGTWTGDPTITFTRQWKTCATHTSSCSDIAGAHSWTYLLQAADVGQWIRISVTAHNAAGQRTAQSATTTTAVTASGGGGGTLTDDPSFVGPSYYAQFANGPSSSMSFWPIGTYQLNLNQWNQLPSRIVNAGVNFVDQAYDGGGQANLTTAAANGLRENVAASLSSFSSSTSAIMSFAMQDEPNSDNSQYAASHCSPGNDTCAGKYVTDANAYRSADPTRPVWGNFSKDVTEWSFPPSGWSGTQFETHMRTMIGSLNIASADVYGWTDPWEWSQANPSGGTGHFGAWVYGHAIDRIKYYNPNIPSYGFVECCDSGDGSSSSNPTNTMMPGMMDSAVWNILVHGGRGWVWWTTDFGSPGNNPYPGATYYGNYAPYGDQKWSAQYDEMQSVDAVVKADAVQLNSPTVTGVSATGAGGVPVTVLGKDVGGKLWLLAQADGDVSHPLSNTASMSATIQLPATFTAGMVLDVLGESRTVTVNASHQIVDTFGTKTEVTTYGSHSLIYGYQHHVYSAQ